MTGIRVGWSIHFASAKSDLIEAGIMLRFTVQRDLTRLNATQRTKEEAKKESAVPAAVAAEESAGGNKLKA